MQNSQPRWTVVTGSTGGIGGEIVKVLARRGDALILINRSEAKAKAQRDEILSEHPDLPVELITADFMDIKRIEAASEAITAIPGRVDALYNNAGILTGKKSLSQQGYESHFAVNTLAPYILIRNLTEKMDRPDQDPPGMIVNFSSSAIASPKSLDLRNLVNPEKVGGLMTTYAQSKLAVTMLVAALSSELKSKNIMIRAIDPGATKSPMTTGGNSGMPKIVAWLAPFLFSPADKQAAKVVKSASVDAFDGRTGIYISNGKEKKMPPTVIDANIQSSLVALLDQKRVV